MYNNAEPLGGATPPLRNKQSSSVVPLPSVAEQWQIEADVESRLSIVNEFDAILKVNMKRADRLRQSILKKAFSGRLLK